MGCEPRRVRLEEVVNEEGIDQTTGGGVVEWLARGQSVAHIL